MITFPFLGRADKAGRLGNSLFQYAFMRCTAQRLGVQFYCPPWIGDQVFRLDDAAIRASQPTFISRKFSSDPLHCGFDEAALTIDDETEVFGFFQSWRFFQHLRDQVRLWYRLCDPIVEALSRRYRHVDLDASAGVHLRFGDKLGGYCRTYRFYFPSVAYYARALQRVGHQGTVCVFSDDFLLARLWLLPLRLRWPRLRFVWMEGNAPHEDLYLMSRCGRFISSPSTLSWWGAWLGDPQRPVVVPAEGAVRPNADVTVRDYWPPHWVQLPAMPPRYGWERLLIIGHVLCHKLLRRPIT
jgi:hypothetical protein